MTSQRLLLALVVLLAAAILGLAFFWHPEGTSGPAATLTDAAAADRDFVLQSAAGPVDTRSLRGQVVLIFFGYTYCPDVCPTSLYTIAQGMQLLKPEEAARVRVLFVSVDPERDTVERLKEYAGFYHPNIVGVTGTPEQVAAVARLYGVIYASQKVSGAAGYVVDHSAATYVLGPEGRLVATLPRVPPPAEMAAEIRRWLPSSLSSPSSNLKGTS
jgi:protein SCO1/2